MSKPIQYHKRTNSSSCLKKATKQAQQNKIVSSKKLLITKEKMNQDNKKSSKPRKNSLFLQKAFQKQRGENSYSIDQKLNTMLKKEVIAHKKTKNDALGKRNESLVSLLESFEFSPATPENETDLQIQTERQLLFSQRNFQDKKAPNRQSLDLSHQKFKFRKESINSGRLEHKSNTEAKIKRKLNERNKHNRLNLRKNSDLNKSKWKALCTNNSINNTLRNHKGRSENTDENHQTESSNTRKRKIDGNGTNLNNKSKLGEKIVNFTNIPSTYINLSHLSENIKNEEPKSNNLEFKKQQIIPPHNKENIHNSVSTQINQSVHNLNHTLNLDSKINNFFHVLPKTTNNSVIEKKKIEYLGNWNSAQNSKIQKNAHESLITSEKNDDISFCSEKEKDNGINCPEANTSIYDDNLFCKISNASFHKSIVLKKNHLNTPPEEEEEQIEEETVTENNTNCLTKSTSKEKDSNNIIVSTNNQSVTSSPILEINNWSASSTLSPVITPSFLSKPQNEQGFRTTKHQHSQKKYKNSKDLYGKTTFLEKISLKILHKKEEEIKKMRKLNSKPFNPNLEKNEKDEDLKILQAKYTGECRKNTKLEEELCSCKEKLEGFETENAILKKEKLELECQIEELTNGFDRFIQQINLPINELDVCSEICVDGHFSLTEEEKKLFPCPEKLQKYISCINGRNQKSLNRKQNLSLPSFPDCVQLNALQRLKEFKEVNLSPIQPLKESSPKDKRVDTLLQSDTVLHSSPKSSKNPCTNNCREYSQCKSNETEIPYNENDVKSSEDKILVISDFSLNLGEKLNPRLHGKMKTKLKVREGGFQSLNVSSTNLNINHDNDNINSESVMLSERVVEKYSSRGAEVLLKVIENKEKNIKEQKGLIRKMTLKMLTLLHQNKVNNQIITNTKSHINILKDSISLSFNSPNINILSPN